MTDGNQRELVTIKKSISTILQRMTIAKYHMKRQEHFYALKQIQIALGAFQEQIAAIINHKDFYNQMEVLVDENAIVMMLQGIFSAMETRDYILLQDLLELQMQPFLTKLQECFAMQFPVEIEEEQMEKNVQAVYQYAFDAGCQAGLFTKQTALRKTLEGEELKSVCDTLRAKVEKCLQQGYQIEYTSCGEYTLALPRRGNGSQGCYYYHTNGNVGEEALHLAESWFEQYRYEYGVIGLGLAYPVRALLQMDAGISVTVAETDKQVFYLACAFGDLAYLLTLGRCRLVLDETLSVVNGSQDEMVWCVHYPAIENIANKQLQVQIEDYFINKSSMRTQMIRLDGNFVKNAKCTLPSVDDLADTFRGKDLYIIAAGPSLDKNMDELKKVGENGIVLATGTVMKKLLNKQIPMDYGILIDAGYGPYTQIQGIESCGVPILVMSTVHHKVVSEYRGERYLICQEGYPPAEELAKERGMALYQSGGSVTTTALELGIRFGCKRIIFVGLDLAYTNGQFHASDTGSVMEMGEENNRYVDAVNGGRVLTGKNLDIYRKWIEERIAGETGSRFIDATEGGAKIKGCKVAKLKEVV